MSVKVDVKKAVQVDGVNGLKSILGVVVIVLAHQIALVGDLIGVYPDSTLLETIATWLEYGLTAVEWLLQIAGNSLLSVGIIHKIMKLFGKA